MGSKLVHVLSVGCYMLVPGPHRPIAAMCFAGLAAAAAHHASNLQQYGIAVPTSRTFAGAQHRQQYGSC